MANNDPIVVDMIALYSRYSRMKKPRWRASLTLYLKRIRLFHSRIDGGVRRSFYTFESTKGDLIDLVYNEDELTWKKEPDALYSDYNLSMVLALVRKEKDEPSRAHRVVPLRLGLVPKARIPKKNPSTGLPLSYRIHPYRFQSESVLSAQVMDIPSRKQQNMPHTKRLHYITATDTGQLYEMVFDHDQSDWLLVRTVDDVCIGGL